MCAFYSQGLFSTSSSSPSSNPSLFSSTSLFAGSQTASASPSSSSFSNMFSSSSNPAFGVGFVPFASSPSPFSVFGSSSPSNPHSSSVFTSSSSSSYAFSSSSNPAFGAGFVPVASSRPSYSDGFRSSSPSIPHSSSVFPSSSSSSFSSAPSFGIPSSTPSLFGIPSSSSLFEFSSNSSSSTSPLFGASSSSELFSSGFLDNSLSSRLFETPFSSTPSLSNPHLFGASPFPSSSAETAPSFSTSALYTASSSFSLSTSPSFSEDKTKNPEVNPVSEENRDKLQEKEYLENAKEGPQSEKNVKKTEIIGEDKKGISASSIKDNMSEPETNSSSSSGNIISEKETRVLKDIPQNPHFHPLQIYSKRVQKNLIRGWDQTFVEIKDKIENLLVEDFWESIDELRQTLGELEGMGYNVLRLRKRLDALMEVMVKKKESWVDIVVLQNKVEDRKIKLERLQSKISKLQAEAEEEQVGINELMDEAAKQEENMQVFNAEFAKITMTSL